MASGNYDAQPLCRLLLRPLTVILILLRLGSFAIGVFREEQLLASKVGTGNVHSRHRQGGSSSRRYERHRDKQIEEFFTRVCGHLRGKVEPYLARVDWALYGGTKETVHLFREQCGFTRFLDGKTLDRPIMVREPKQATLEAAIADAWSSRIIRWYDEN